MKENDKRQSDNNFIEQKVAEAFGYSDEQLSKELDRFKEEAEKSDHKALEAPDGEFQRIWNRVERERDESRRKSGRVRKLVKVMAVAAILGIMVLGGGMWVGAKRHYVQEVREREDLENVIAINNSPDNLIEDDIPKDKLAYKRIADELNIKVLELSYLPDGMVLHEIEIIKEMARLEFSYENNWLYFYQGIGDKPTSLSYASDMREYQSVYNPFLDKTFSIYGKELENGNVEYSTRIVEGDHFYILEGIIDIEEFVNITHEIKVYAE